MKILLVSEFFPTGKDLRFSGGVEARTYFVGKELAKKHKVYVLTSRLPKTRSSEKIKKMIILRVGKPRKYIASVSDISDRLNFVVASVKAGKKLDVDVVDGSNFITHFIARRISASNRIPSVAWYPDVWVGRWLKNVGPLGILGELLERFNLALNFNAYIAISKQTARELERKVKPVSVIGCGIELSEFKNKKVVKNGIKIVCISRLASYKRVEDLIWASAALIKKGLDINVQIIGQGPKEKELKKIVSMLKLQGRIIFQKNLTRKKLVQELKSSSIFSLPSAVEGFGISVIEAAAAGVPYVIPDIPVFKEITKQGRGGLFFKLGDINGLAIKLESLINNKKLYKSKVKEAESLAKDYEWKKIALQTESVYKSVL